jgi:chromosomal replication initiator protein
MEPADQVWQRVLDQLELEVSRPNFNTWLSKTYGIGYSGKIFKVGVPNSFVAEYLDKNLRSLLEKILFRLSSPGLKLTFEVSKRNQQPIKPLVLHPLSGPFHPRLNPRYTFDSFIVGRSNRLAHSSALGAINSTSEGYNPIFIYGEVGLGKTHLLQAIGHMAVEAKKRVLYVSGEQFTREFISSIKDSKSDEFHRRYRDTDLLLVDDIQFIGGKEQTEENFFHTFNDLHNSGRQIVISSNVPPNDIPKLGNRLRSRFGWGLAVEIRPPEHRTRLAILKTKVRSAGIDVEPSVLEFIAHRITKSVRELEGCLNRIVAYARLLNKKITADIARQAISAIGDNLPATAGHDANMIINAVTTCFRCHFGDITGRRRDKEMATIRQITMYLLKKEAGLSLQEIGRIIGGRSVSTVSHACGRISSDLENSAAMRRKLRDIQHWLK